MPDAEIPFVEAQTRFVLFFNFEAKDRIDLSRKVESVRWRDQQIWRADELPGAYGSEYLSGFSEFYFGEAAGSYYTIPARFKRLGWAEPCSWI